MTTRDVLKRLASDGWFKVGQQGSHWQFKHATKAGKVTVSVHRMSDHVKPGTLRSIKAQASRE
jgi:predicted RNA binding protein YcfA (HicA-like mRNA interferase family)